MAERQVICSSGAGRRAHWRYAVAQNEQAKRRALDVSQRELQLQVQQMPGIEILARKKDHPKRTLAGRAGRKNERRR
jgi:hypothetical protein